MYLSNSFNDMLWDFFLFDINILLIMYFYEINIINICKGNLLFINLLNCRIKLLLEYC